MATKNPYDAFGNKITVGEFKDNFLATYDVFGNNADTLGGLSSITDTPASNPLNPKNITTFQFGSHLDASQGAVKGGQSDYNVGTGFFLGYSGGVYKFSFGIGGATTNNVTWDGTTLTVNGYVVSGKGAFGGDGSDGALLVTSGTTTIDLGSASVVTKNYSSVVITGTGAIAFSNPHANGTKVILKSQGAVTLTSSATALINVSNVGAAGGAAVTGGTVQQGNVGKDYADVFDTANHYGDGGTVTDDTPNGGTGGATGSVLTQTGAGILYTISVDRLLNKTIFVAPGAGGGGGSSGSHRNGAGTTGNGGAGGAGGGALIIECGGALNFSGTINASGTTGSAGGAGTASGANSAGGGGGGGGGSAGFVVILYNTLTANTGTISVAGGAGGAGGAGDEAGANKAGGGGGGGGGSFNGIGNAGSNGVSGTGTGNGGAGGTGGTGFSLVALNNEFA